jgi:hypothetical protein
MASGICFARTRHEQCVLPGAGEACWYANDRVPVDPVTSCCPAQFFGLDATCDSIQNG